MSGDTKTETIDAEYAARLTLFVLRSDVPAGWDLRDDLVLFEGDEEPMPAGDAVPRLVQAPKPFTCYAEVSNDTLVVRTRLPASVRRLHEDVGREARELAVVGDRTTYGDAWREVKVLCLGRDDWHIVTLGELVAWHRDYPFTGWRGYARRPIAEAETGVQGAWQVPAQVMAHARTEGVVEVRLYHWRRDDRDVPHVAIARIEPGTRDTPLCEHCREREARYTVEWMEDEYPPRHWCQRCIDAELGIEAFNEGRDLEKLRQELEITELTGTPAELRERAEELAFDWALKYRAPFIEDFIARHRVPA
jgi:hypothetical protein